MSTTITPAALLARQHRRRMPAGWGWPIHKNPASSTWIGFVRLRRGGDDVCLNLQAKAEHPQRAAQAGLPIQAVIARDDMQHLASVRQRHRFGGIHGAFQVIQLHAARVGDAHRASAVDRLDMSPGNRDERAPDFVAAAGLSLVDRRRNGCRERAHIRDGSPAHPARRLDARTEHINIGVAHFADDGADLRRADVDAYNEFAHVLVVSDW
jgi:hypothetical protein